MNRELLMEPSGEWVAATNKVEIPNNIHNVNISIRASLEQEVIQWIGLWEVSQNLTEVLHVHWRTLGRYSCNLPIVFQQLWSPCHLNQETKIRPGLWLCNSPWLPHRKGGRMHKAERKSVTLDSTLKDSPGGSYCWHKRHHPTACYGCWSHGHSIQPSW